MASLSWCIYYPDGKTFSSDDGAPQDAPARGVQVIVQEDYDVGFHLQTGDDYYLWNGEKFVGVDIFGLFDFLIETGLVKFGRMITNAEYREIFDWANTSRKWLNKNSFKPNERKVE